MARQAIRARRRARMALAGALGAAVLVLMVGVAPASGGLRTAGLGADVLRGTDASAARKPAQRGAGVVLWTRRAVRTRSRSKRSSASASRNDGADPLQRNGRRARKGA